MLRAAAFGRGLTLADIDRATIDGFLGHLAGLGITVHSQRGHFGSAKSILYGLASRGLISLVATGDDATFPRNPFPNCSSGKGETPLPKRQRQLFASALRKAVAPIWDDHTQVTGELLAYVLLTVALHTGRNTTPLLEMRRDCLRAHPKDNSTFLVLWKRRGYTSHKVALRAEISTETHLESTPIVKTNVERLIRRVLALSEPLRAESPDYCKERVWLYRVHRGPGRGRINTLHVGTLVLAIKS